MGPAGYVQCQQLNELLAVELRQSRSALSLRDPTDPHGSCREGRTQWQGDGVLLVPRHARDACDPSGDVVPEPWRSWKLGRASGSDTVGAAAWW